MEIHCAIEGCPSVINLPDKSCSATTRYECAKHTEFYWSAGKELRRRSLPHVDGFSDEPVFEIEPIGAA
jgi:hypothetical protein